MIRVIDLETTGDDPTKHGIVEVAAIDIIKTDTGIGVKNPMQAYCNPGHPIPPEMSAIHHIIDADVAVAKPVETVMDRFRGADVYVAHNADFERKFLAQFDLRQIVPESKPPQWLCTYKCALRLWPDLPSHKLQALRYHFGMIAPFGMPRDAISPHRAASDVIVTAAVLSRIMGTAKDAGQPWGQLIAWSDEPTLFTRFNFGKHKGQRIDEIARSDPSYLHWIMEKSDLDEGAKFSAGYWLDRPAEKAA